MLTCQISDGTRSYYHKVIREEIKYDEVLATKYNPVPEQCDGDPLVTADNSKISLSKLKSHKLKWVAVSQDLLDKYKFGDTITVISDNKKLSGKWIIHDVMNKRHRKRVDFLVPLNDKYEFYKPMKIKIRKYERRRIV